MFIKNANLIYIISIKYFKSLSGWNALKILYQKKKMVQKAPTSLDFIERSEYSYPINFEYPNAIAFSGVQSGLLMAYGSSNSVIVLTECRYLKSVLKGHKSDVCALTFEMNGPNIIVCDTSGTIYFWNYNSSDYIMTYDYYIGMIVKCISWFQPKREICFSSKNGLYLGEITSKNIKMEKIFHVSSFCAFNFTGSLLASHNYGKIVTIFLMSSFPYVMHTAKHINPVVTFEFHPHLQMFLTITKDYILHIWIQTAQTGFICSSIVKVYNTGHFIHYPLFYAKKLKENSKPSKIVFVDSKNKLYYLKVDQRGQIIESEEKLSPKVTDSKLMCCYKTNFGKEVILLEGNGISVITKDHSRKFLFHQHKISQIEFQKKTDWVFTRDENGCLIVWPLYDCFYSSRIASQNAKIARWFDDQSLVFLNERRLMIYYNFRDEINELLFPETSNCRDIFVYKNKILYILTKTKLIRSKSEVINKDVDSFKIIEFTHHCFSEVFEDKFILITSILSKDSSTSHLCIYLLPDFEEIDSSIIINDSIKSISALSLYSFVVLTNNDLIFYSFKNNAFQYHYSFSFPGINGIKYTSPFLFSYDSKHIYSIANGIFPILNNINISNITTSESGHLAYTSEKSFSIIPSWHIPKSSGIIQESSSTIPKKQDFIIRDISDDTKRLNNFTKQRQISYMISPFVYSNPPQKSYSIIRSTLVHLIEYESLFDFKPRQVPAVPNQYALPLSLPPEIRLKKPKNNNIISEIEKISPSNPENYSNHLNQTTIISAKNNPNFTPKDKPMKYIDYLEGINEDIDLYGMRYIYALNESMWPPSYFGLWCLFSLKQSSIADYLQRTIDTNALSKFYVGATLILHSHLVRVVKSAIDRMWNQYNKVENVALFLVALGQQTKISKLYNAIGENQKADFFTHDFTIEKHRKSGIKNAYSSLKHGGYEMSATLFIISGDIKSGINVIIEKLSDPILAFLVLRLITKSNYQSEIMKWFFTQVSWNDDILPILISRLAEDGKTSELLKSAILEKNISKNISAYGDRRIALFQIYRYLTKDESILPELSQNLLNDGLAPLALYLYEFVKCPFNIARSVPVDQEKAFQEDNCLLNEPSDSSDSSKYDNENDSVIVTQIESFDFGGIKEFSSLSEDDWSDSDSNISQILEPETSEAQETDRKENL